MSSKNLLSFVKRVLLAGWASLALSSLFLFISGYTTIPEVDTSGPNYVSALWLMLARIAGLATFGIGVFGLFHQRWTAGTLQIILSIVLPFIALYLHGTI